MPPIVAPGDARSSMRTSTPLRRSGSSGGRSAEAAPSRSLKSQPDQTLWDARLGAAGGAGAPAPPPPGSGLRLEPGGLVKAQRQVQVLHASTARALAQVVEPCQQPHRALVLVAEAEDLQVVRVVERVWAQEGPPLERVHRVQRRNRDKP
eukprot:CAMPEP_0171287276 /NCGR_PEP_ID=MMETSP0790-20130122/69463_1 /TAXON_ID=2925 /ORGANISM="Alexandrium catenella, Strain OF101" /LENGTH=149 /DNA_ID=CAMNT_0011756783 /DNA_START=88 /DNA_END=535 /DNA_ORIENTATION=+